MSLRPIWGNLIRPISKGGAKGSALVTHQPSVPFSVFGRHTYSYLKNGGRSSVVG